MNAPTDLSHLAPELHLRAIPDALLASLQQRFGAQCSTALAVRQQHGRDESIYEVPPRPRWCLPRARRMWPTR